MYEDTEATVDGFVEESPIYEKKGVIEDVKSVNAEALPLYPAASREELKRVFKRAAWYSLALALVVTIIGECALSLYHRTGC